MAKFRPVGEQVVVVTGASSGIGREAARQFAAAGARVVLAARRREALEALADEIRAAGGTALAVPTDVTDPAAVEALAAAAEAAFGRIDTWVNNAAVMLYAPAATGDLADMRQVFEANFWGAVHGYRAAVPRLVRAGGGVVVCVGSVESDAAVPLQSAYAGSKHALRAFCEAARMELAQAGLPVAVALIKPAAVDTPIYQAAKTPDGKAARKIGPVADPAEPARAIVAAAERPPREQLVGAAAVGAVALHTFAPELWDAFMTWFTTKQLADVPAPDDAPAAARSDDALGTVAMAWLAEHPLALATGAVTTGLALAAWARRPG